MPSRDQVSANKANAKRSTGPRTNAGRKRSSLNAVRHGLTRPLGMSLLRSCLSLRAQSPHSPVQILQLRRPALPKQRSRSGAHG
jgi:hypothetical protein